MRRRPQAHDDEPQAHDDEPQAHGDEPKQTKEHRPMTYPATPPPEGGFGQQPSGPPSPYGSPHQPPNPYGSPQPSPYGSPHQPWPGSSAGMPDKQIGWVVVAFLLFLPLGVVALLESNKVEERWRQGDYAGSQLAAQNVKKWGIWGLAVGVGFWVLALCVLPVLFLGAPLLCGLANVGAAAGF